VKSANAEAQKMPPRIQKRTMIFVSDQAFISKWWVDRRHEEDRRPRYLNVKT